MSNRLFRSRNYVPSAALYAGGVAAPFDPLSLSPTIFYDLSDSSTVYQERTGSPPATASAVNDVVGSIFNLGSLGGYATAPADADRGILRQSGSTYYVELDGTSDGYDFSWSSTNADMWVAAAFRMTGGSTNYPRIVTFANTTTGSDTSGGNGFIAMCRNNGTSAVMSYHNGASRASAAYTMSSDSVGDVQTSSTISQIAINNGTPVTSSYTFSPNFTVGRLGCSFQGISRVDFLAGRLYAVIAGTGTLSSGDRSSLLTYMGNKAGISI